MTIAYVMLYLLYAAIAVFILGAVAFMFKSS